MYQVPYILGKPLNIWEGAILFFLLIFQLLSGLQVIKVDYKIHKWNGILIFTIAMVHAFIGFGVWFFGYFRY